MRWTENKIEQNQRGEHLRVVGHVPQLINRHLSIAACRYAIRCISIRPLRNLSAGTHIFFASPPARWLPLASSSYQQISFFIGDFFLL